MKTNKKHRIPFDKYENHKNIRTTYENHGTNENHRIPFENHEKLKILKIHTRITKIMKIIEFHVR